MTDYFAMLDEPRRPWLDADALKAKFLARSTEVHPDRVHNTDEAARANASRRYAELNSAYNCLREPKDRLAHLVELELGHRPKDVQEIPANLADFFVEIAGLCRQADGFLTEKRGITSPLLQVKTFEKAQEWSEKLGVLRTRLNALHDAIAEELKNMNPAWAAASDPAARSQLLKRLEELYRLLSYFARWGGQIQERIFQLSN